MKIHINIRNRFLFLADLVLILACVLGSFVLRLNLGPLFMDHLGRALVMLAVAIVIKPIVYYSFGLYRRLWIYASVGELMLVTTAVTSASIIVSLVIVIIWAFQIFPSFSRGVLVIDWILSLLAVGGIRFALRIMAESQAGTLSAQQQFKRRVLIVGAGDAGVLVIREMQKSARLSSPVNPSLVPVCFVDDDLSKQKQEIHGIPVAGTLKAIPQVVERFQIQEVIIAIPSAPGSVIRSVAEICQRKGIPFRTMPSIHELIGGKVSVNRLREVELTDLLRREPVQIDNHLIGLSISGKRVLVTGAGGSIGRELCRQIAHWGPMELLLLGHGENSIFEIAIELEQNFPNLAIISIIADVRNDYRLHQVFQIHHPQVIFHTAAHKHVPLMENNVEEAITNNIQGTLNVVEAAIQTGVERLVMVSTDKAVEPSSIYGATKRIAEMLVIEAARRTQNAYSVVRFGNVLGSRGSIIPIFKQQIARGGPVTITHPEMERYFMTIPEAVHLVLQTAAMGKGGETFALNMGKQVRILDLAEDLIRLSGLEPGKDIEITYTGIRPGEKLKEKLWDQGAYYNPTNHPDIFSLAEETNDHHQDIEQFVSELIHLAYQGETEAIFHLMSEFIPGATIRSAPPPDITAII
jgi:FlaA1/EpsC-like NDP-sugar epimerase